MDRLNHFLSRSAVSKKCVLLYYKTEADFDGIRAMLPPGDFNASLTFSAFCARFVHEHEKIVKRGDFPVRVEVTPAEFKVWCEVEKVLPSKRELQRWCMTGAEEGIRKLRRNN